MTALGHRLPMEVWLNIFDQIQDKRQLAQCKLTCKRWAPIVERAMLKSIVVTKNMDKLCEHLQKNPKSRQYVHDIEIAPYYWVENEDDREELDRSLTVLMTKNLRAIKGEDAYGSGVLKTLIQVLQSPTGKSVKLEQLPIGRNTSSKLVVPELLHHFRETLKSMEIRSEWG